MREEQDLKVTVKKTDLHAANSYQYHKLETAPFYFVPCQLEESYDEIHISFDTENLCTLLSQKNMREVQRYSVLIQLLEARKYCPEYLFSVAPNNLWIDPQGRVRILMRDIGQGTKDEADQWFLDLKALAGALFQKKYSFEHYKQGGMALLKKKRRTSYLLELRREQDALSTFVEAQKKVREFDEKEYSYVRKQGYHRSVTALIFALIGFVGVAGWGGYQHFWVTVPQQKALLAERAYMEEDLIGVVDALAGLPVEQMDRHEKYILAVSFIRGQSVDTFTTLTKNMLISKLSYNGDENLLDYWIHLGRLEVDQALDIAQRISDNQLILYAYLQKLDQISADLTLSGEEKAQQTSSLQGKIKALAEDLGITYKESQ